MGARASFVLDGSIPSDCRFIHVDDAGSTAGSGGVLRPSSPENIVGQSYLLVLFLVGLAFFFHIGWHAGNKERAKG